MSDKEKDPTYLALRQERDDALAVLVERDKRILFLELRQAEVATLIHDYIWKCWSETATEPGRDFSHYHPDYLMQMLPAFYRTLTRPQREDER